MAACSLFERLALHAPHLAAQQHIPAFIYGTAWKKDATTELVYQALCKGFTAIDTAAQPKHYREDLVGAGLRRAVKDGKVRRSDVYLQTKFTSVEGQDVRNMPYKLKDPVAQQVTASVESSLRNFIIPSTSSEDQSQPPYIDTLVLHSPMRSMQETLEVWSTLERYVPGQIHNLGISNCDLFTLMELYERASVKPVVVQNRFHAETRFDIGVRKFCQENSIIYESFWTLSANPGLLRSIEVKQLANELQISPQSALYCLVMGLGNIVILNGTKNAQHMQDDWEALSVAKDFAISNSTAWAAIISKFKKTIGQPS